MGAGVDHAVVRVGVGKIVARFPAVKGKLHDTQGANWQWRLDTPLTSLLAEHIADLTALYDRAPAVADR